MNWIYGSEEQKPTNDIPPIATKDESPKINNDESTKTNSNTPSQNDPKAEDVRKLLDDLDKMWWSTKPYEGYCGNCQRYAMLRPQDAGMFCDQC